MSIITERDRLRLLQVEAPGVKTAFRFVPRQIEDSELPAFVTFVGRGGYALRGKQNLRVQRLYRMQLYVARLMSGSEGKAEAQTEALIEPIQDYFIARPRMERNDTGLVTVLETTLSEDIGILSGRYPFNDESALFYIYIEFRYTVESIRVIPHQISG